MNQFKSCVACTNICGPKVFAAKSYVDASYGHFQECETCGTLNVVEEIDYDLLYSTRNSTNYPSIQGGFVNRVFALLKEVYMGILIPRFLKGAAVGASVLDYGCGSGDLVNSAVKSGRYAVSAADVQSERPGNLNPTVDYFSTENLPSEKKFDLIIMRHVLEHISVPSRALQSITTHLKQDGRILVEVPSERSIFRRWMGARWPGYFYPYHVTVFSQRGLQALAARNGLEIVDEKACNPPMLGVFFQDLGLNRGISRTLSLLLYPIQWMLNLVASSPEAIMVRLQSKQA